jgi:hypothetical protein
LRAVLARKTELGKMNRKHILLFVILVSCLFGSCEEKESIIMNPIIIDFPLKGEWIAPNTPGYKIPSHGLDLYGETYAYDFVKVEEGGKSLKFYDTSVVDYIFHGVPLNKCFGWGSEIYCPCDGEIVKVENNVDERKIVKLSSDLKYTKDVTKKFTDGKAEYREVAGNYVILKIMDNVYALFAHLKKDSINVIEGQKIVKGKIIGRVGHSGNSTAPHLHFQLMDNIDFQIAKGIPCAFDKYEIQINGKWNLVNNGIPGKNIKIKGKQ